MGFDIALADRVREYLVHEGESDITEKKMFSGLAFLVNGKMCINVSGENLMCRFDPDLQDEVAERRGFKPMVMRGRQMKGYCYVTPDGFQTTKDFNYWIKQCLDFNPKAKTSRQSGKKI
jgi:TfoX/Sxy family transcriptional regulator of competence genes